MRERACRHLVRTLTVTARSSRQGSHPDRGASALELTFIAPALLAFIFCSIQTGLYFYGRTVALQAAREGVSVLRTAQTGDIASGIEEGVERTVEDFALTLGRASLLDPQADAVYDAEAGRVSVTVTGSVITLVPGVDLAVTQRAFGEVERFEGDLRPEP